MRKIIAREMITIDGFFAGQNGEIDWHRVDDEFNEDSIEFLENIDTLMFGRVTYDLMASYWPTSAAADDNSIITGKMNSLRKIVFSKSLSNAGWNNSKVVSDINASEIQKIKQTPGKDIAIFGSGMLVASLAKLGLIDEYRLIVNPVILGDGKSLWSGAGKKTNLKLIQTKEFRSGNVLLCYKVT